MSLGVTGRNPNFASDGLYETISVSNNFDRTGSSEEKRTDIDQTIIRAHDLEKVKMFILSVLLNNCTGVQMEKLIRIDKKTDDYVNPYCVNFCGWS